MTLTTTTDSTTSATPSPILPVKKTGTRVFGYVVLAIALAVAIAIIANPNFKWGTVGRYFFDPNIMVGIVNTILLTVASMVAGTVIGTILALMKLSRATQLTVIAEGYIWLFRGVPLLVQLLFWFNLAALFPDLGFGIPGTDFFMGINTNAIISPFMAAFLALALHEGAYMAEIIRSGILSIDKGQTEAAEALAMESSSVMFRIILPQAMRVIVPPTGNQIISMLKTTSLVSVIAFNDLLYSAQIIYSGNYQVIPLLLVASLWYLVIVSLLTLVQSRIERHFARSTHVVTAKKVGV